MYREKEELGLSDTIGDRIDKCWKEVISLVMGDNVQLLLQLRPGVLKPEIGFGVRVKGRGSSCGPSFFFGFGVSIGERQFDDDVILELSFMKVTGETLAIAAKSGVSSLTFSLSEKLGTAV